MRSKIVILACAVLGAFNECAAQSVSRLQQNSLMSAPHDVAISPDSRFAVVCAGHSPDAITFYSMTTGLPIGTFPSLGSAGPLPGTADSVAISPNSATTVVIHGRNVRTFDTTGPTPTENGTFTLATDPHDLEIAPNGSFAVVRTGTANGLNGQVAFFLLTNPPTPLTPFFTATCPLFTGGGINYTSDSIAVSANSARVVAIGGAGNDGVLIFDTSGAPVLLATRFLHTPAHDVEITPDNNFAVVRCAASPDGVAVVPIALAAGTAIGSGSFVAPLSGNGDYLAISPTGTSAVVLGKGGAADTVVTLNTFPTNPPLVPLNSVSLSQEPFDVTISPDGRLALVQADNPTSGGGSGVHVFFSMTTGAISATTVNTSTLFSIRAAADTVQFSPDSQRAVALGTPSAASGSLGIYDTSSMTPTLLVPPIAINTVPHDVEVSPNGAFVAVRAAANSDQATTFYSLTTGARFGMFGSSGSPTINTSDSIVISPDSTGAVAIGADFNTVDVFAVAAACTPPSITMHPSSQTVCAGQTVSFSVSASGTPPPSFQWRRDGSPIAGANAAMYVVSSASPSHAGSYDVVVSNPCGSATSQAAALTVRTAPTFAEHPGSLERCVEHGAAFGVGVMGDPAPALQWRHNGVPISGATTSMLLIESVMPADAGTYDCVASNTCATVVSSAASLVVLTNAPSIALDPVSQQVCIGQPVSLTVGASGQGTVAFLWRKNGAPVSGATAPVLAISSPSPADSGSYDCIVSNGCGSVTSGMATLTVANSAPSVTMQPAGQEVCAGQPITFTIVADGTPPLAYQWRHDGAPIPGASSSALAIPAASPVDAGVYDCVVTNLCGSMSSGAATLTVLAAPLVTTHPESVSVTEGSSVAFTIAASGTAPLTYQWRRNGIDLTDTSRVSGSGTVALTISATVPEDAGAYDAVITNVCGDATSDTATLAVARDCAEWGLVANTEPSPRREPAMAFDTDRARVVLFGGFDSYPANLPDTWEWNGTAWMLRSTTGPTPRYRHAISYDSARHVMVLFGGDVGNNGSDRSDTWTWDGSAWTQQQPAAHPEARHNHAMAFDAARGELILFGGIRHLNTYFADTWAWNGTVWTLRHDGTNGPVARGAHAMAYDADSGVVVLFGGFTSDLIRLNDTWEWNGTTWTERFPVTTPGARNAHAMAYDSRRGVTLLFGGFDGSMPRNDTWQWDSAAGTWTQRMIGQRPPPRNSHALAFDAQRGPLVLFGGNDDNVGLYGDTWTLRICPGDLNCDGRIDNFDIDPFVFTLVDPAGYALVYPDCDRNNADINADGSVDNFDIDPFVALLTGG